jgi:hypothetical protein
MECNCGLFGCWQLSNAPEVDRDRRRWARGAYEAETGVYAQMRCYGAVLMGSLGCRAEKSMIEMLVVPTTSLTGSNAARNRTLKRLFNRFGDTARIFVKTRSEMLRMTAANSTDKAAVNFTPDIKSMERIEETFGQLLEKRIRSEFGSNRSAKATFARSAKISNAFMNRMITNGALPSWAVAAKMVWALGLTRGGDAYNIAATASAIRELCRKRDGTSFTLRGEKSFRKAVRAGTINAQGFTI